MAAEVSTERPPYPNAEASTSQPEEEAMPKEVGGYEM
jgi:hypothetical protein